MFLLHLNVRSAQAPPPFRGVAVGAGGNQVGPSGTRAVGKGPWRAIIEGVEVCRERGRIDDKVGEETGGEGNARTRR